MPKLTDFFQTLNRVKIPYVVLRGYHAFGDLMGSEGALTILTEAKQRFVEVVTDLVKLDANSYKLPSDPENPDKYIRIELIEKGNGCFPERFESELLARAQWHPDETHGPMKIPDSSVRGYAALYWFLFREGGWKDVPEVRRAVQQLVEERVGPYMQYRADRRGCMHDREPPSRKSAE